MSLRVVAGYDPHGSRQMHGFIEPGRHLLGARVPVRRDVSVVPLHRDKPRAALLGDGAERIVVRHMEFELRHLAVLLDQAEWQMRGNRTARIARDHCAKAASPGECEARRGMHLEGWMDVHGSSPVRATGDWHQRGFSRGRRGASSGGMGLIRSDRTPIPPGKRAATAVEYGRDLMHWS